MTRRNMFACLAGAAIDPDRLIWQPGKKFFSLPPAPQVVMSYTIYEKGQHVFPLSLSPMEWWQWERQLRGGRHYDVIGSPSMTGRYVIVPATVQRAFKWTGTVQEPFRQADGTRRIELTVKSSQPSRSIDIATHLTIDAYMGDRSKSVPTALTIDPAKSPFLCAAEY